MAIQSIASANGSMYLDWMDDYGVTKFIGPDGTGHRGVICWLSRDKTAAILFGQTGEYTNWIVSVRETDPDNWPVFVAQHGSLDPEQLMYE